MITFQRLGTYGQFGNQLFQYSLLVAVSEKTGFDFGVPYSQKSKDKYSHFTLPDVFPNLTAKDSSGSTPSQRYDELEGHFWTFKSNVFDVQDGTDFSGYFQSYKYFTDCRERLLTEFTPLPIYKEHAGNYLSDLRAKGKPVIFVHVRRGDALGNRSLVQPTTKFYNQASNHFPDSSFVILTDDNKWCRRLRLPNMYFSPFTDKFDDFELMKQADGGIICSSTFSWWGAWLGDLSRKIVCPKRWSPNHPCNDILPSEWIGV